jgi:hypothetical protein
MSDKEKDNTTNKVPEKNPFIGQGKMKIIFTAIPFLSYPTIS